MSGSGRAALSAAIAGVAGVLFGLGLVLAGMTDPKRVVDFLDVAGDWNPALALVMGAAVVVAAPCFALARRRGRTLLGAPVQLPDRWHVDARLLLGTAVFGVGWGLSGICPGPGIVLLAGGSAAAVVFVGAVIVGMRLADLAAEAMPPATASPASQLPGRGAPAAE
jgi:uncharacterized protein